MPILEASRTVWTSRALSVFRIVAGLIFFSYGTMKVFGYPPSPAPIPAFSPASLLGIAGLIEMTGGIAIILGLVTRPVAFVLAGEMAVAYFYQHFPKSFFPTTNMGVPAVLFCFFFLYLTFAGAGAWSLDALISRKKWVQRLAAERHAEKNKELELEIRPRPRPVGPSRPVLHRG
jgi:putative oxidoreductase